MEKKDWKYNNTLVLGVQGDLFSFRYRIFSSHLERKFKIGVSATWSGVGVAENTF